MGILTHPGPLYQPAPLGTSICPSDVLRDSGLHEHAVVLQYDRQVPQKKVKM